MRFIRRKTAVHLSYRKRHRAITSHEQVKIRKARKIMVSLMARRSIEGNLDEALEEILEYYTSVLLSLSFDDEDEVDEDELVSRRPDEKRSRLNRKCHQGKNHGISPC